MSDANPSRERETTAALLEMEKMATLGSLLAGVAHEINTPVGSIHANADVMLRALERLRNALEPIDAGSEIARLLDLLEGAARVNKTASERIVTMVRSLRNMTRLDDSERKEASLVEGLESTLTLIGHELENRIDVVRDYGDLPDVCCYASRLNQVFLNLFVNAAHAMEGRGTLTVRTWREGATVKVSISDTGHGIRPEHLARLFEPGFTTKARGVGTGLGLAISKQIASEHGGRIEVRSEVGRGTTFTITLPVGNPGVS